jgi:hypothetical protein
MKKNYILAIAGFFLLIAVFFACTPKQPKEGIHSSAELKKLFGDPPSEYRSAPLWDWNEQVT